MAGDQRLITAAARRDDSEPWNLIEDLDAWSEALGRTHVPFSLTPARDTGRHDFSASVRAQSVGEMSLVDVVTAPYGGRRTLRHVHASPRDVVVFQYIAAGRQVVRQGDDVLTVGSGDLLVWDNEANCSYEVLETVQKHTLVVPRPLAESLLPVAHTPALVQTIPGRRSSGVQPLFGLLSALSDNLALMSTEATKRSVALVVQMLADLEPRHHNDQPKRGRRASRHLCEQVVGHIEANLGDTTLNPATIAAAHFVSTRTLYASLEGLDTTLAAHIRARRLARCYADLLTGDDPVGDVAARWGFVNLAHFSRTFTKQYGIAPSRVRPRSQ
jgi:AraC-like DNA-binding protein